MKSWDVRVFEVPYPPPGVKFNPAKHRAHEVSPATVKAATVDKAKRQLSERFEDEGRKLRSINIGPNERTGKHEFIVYLQGAEEA